MESEATQVVQALSALAQEHRLAIYRHLVRRGTTGSPVGELREHLGLPGATLSHHLNQLLAAGLVKRRREGRSLIYRANFVRMRGLVAYLTEECCRG